MQLSTLCPKRLIGMAALVCTAALIPAVLAAGSPAAASTAAGHRYRLIDLGTLGGKVSEAFGLNQRGDAVGSSSTRDGQTHAFLWRNGKMTDLGTLGGNSSAATAVNSRDQVVGVSDLAGNTVEHAFLWQRGKMTDLGTLPGDRSSLAFAINDRGQVVGISFSSTGDHGFLWQHGKMTSLGVTTAEDINNAGEIVGTTGSYAYMWRRGKITILPRLPSPFHSTQAAFINNRGQIAGTSASPDNYALAVVWRHQKLTSLGTPKGDAPTGLNDRGMVLVPPDFLWWHGKVTNLATLGVSSATLHGINDRAELVGAVYVAGKTAYHAALWMYRSRYDK